MNKPLLSKPRLVIGSFLILLIGVGAVAQAVGISLPRPVPSFSQNYTVGPDPWGDSTLGSDGCPDRFSVSGCLVTAFASVLAYYGIELSVPAAQSFTGRSSTGMDPGILNDWLRAHGGFGRCAGDAYGACCLEWSRLPGGIELTFYTNRSDVGLNPVAGVVIDHALRQGYPVIAGVHWGVSCNGSGQTEDCHWVVLTGKVGDTYTIVDPYNPDPRSPRGVRTTLDDGTRGSYIIDRFVVVTGPIPTGEEEELPPIEPGPASDAGSDRPSAFSSVAILVLLLAVLAAIVLATVREG